MTYTFLSSGAILTSYPSIGKSKNGDRNSLLEISDIDPERSS